MVTAGLIKLATERARLVLGVAGAVFVVAAAVGLPITARLKERSQDFQSPSSQYERGLAMVRKATGQAPGYGVAALLSGAHAIRTDRSEQRATRYLAALLAHQRGFQRELDYPADHLGELISRDGRKTLIVAAFATPEDSADAVSRVQASLSRPSARRGLAGMNPTLGGPDVVAEELSRRSTADLKRAELFAFPIILILLFWVFRGFVTAFLPALVGGFAIVLTLLALRVIDQLTPISIFALDIVTGLGLGLGIDYSLFILWRYREELAGGADTRTAMARTLATAGRTVFYSSLIVAAALTSLLVFPTGFLFSMGIGGAIAALADGAVALIVLPALLVALGGRINAFSPAWLRRSAERTARASEHSAWAGLARAVMRRPGLVALATGTALIAAALPVTHLKLIAAGADLLPSSAPANQIERAIADDFTVNSAEAMYVVAPANINVLSLVRVVERTAGGRASEAPLDYLGRGTWEIVLLAHGSPFSAGNQRLLRRLRAAVNPVGALVGGWTAYFVDQKQAIASRIPLALLILLLVTGGALFSMTRSVVLPLKGLAMNLLTACIGAGLLVLIFQDGHLSSLLGFTPIGGLEESSLVLLFVITFALSTDYEIFLLGRIKEGHDAGLSNRDAVALGIERTGRLITAAALLFCVAVGALSTSSVFLSKQFGFGTALTVAIDASIVRMLLVPSLMALLGDWNWWAPTLRRRGHRRIGLGERTALDAGMADLAPSVPASTPAADSIQSPVE